MTPLELAARRKRIGLSQEELGRCLSLVSPMPDGSSRPPVRQSTIASWEGSRGIPASIDLALPGMLDLIEEQSDVMCDRIQELIEHSSAVRNDSHVTVKGYAADGDFWRDWPDMTGWPHVLWNIAATVAIDEMMDDYGITATLSDTGKDER
ncbi:DNA-binding helix-turn-helix protein [Bifidobacterium saguini DSM 23967]|uniref:DNA-binding helix-turn-helix protein n=1 Tax=Bifidobacterium saguini DSM 23967 TaxID=1437607 RepID=A0A087DCH2_9BIFI|nr:transcriptional regulator [Bifidobacterium saguini]KFI93222.1 DNA-binding helix-turn-helix protein [Bifidobacterium saguini DSM 23967]